MNLISSHITLLDNRWAISITIKIGVKLLFVEVKTSRYRTFSIALISCSSRSDDPRRERPLARLGGGLVRDGDIDGNGFILIPPLAGERTRASVTNERN